MRPDLLRKEAVRQRRVEEKIFLETHVWAEQVQWVTRAQFGVWAQWVTRAQLGAWAQLSWERGHGPEKMLEHRAQ
ncbi:hypothetical protein FCV25MIE_33931 [Fagus crenata]